MHGSFSMTLTIDSEWLMVDYDGEEILSPAKESQRTDSKIEGWEISELQVGDWLDEMGDAVQAAGGIAAAVEIVSYYFKSHNTKETNKNEIRRILEDNKSRQFYTRTYYLRVKKNRFLFIRF